MHTTPPRPRIGLALGGGAARGLAHIGVLKVLEQADIPIDIIAGTSMGAFIGAMYAAGVPIDHMEKAALEIDWRSMARLLDPVLPTSGLTDSKKLVSFIAELLPARDFEDLNRPLAITATDINTGEAVIIKQGDLLEALRAGLAFPGIFSPVRFGQRFLVDGGLCKPIPIDVARHLGADKVIGVCTIPAVNKQTPETFLPAVHGLAKPVSRWRKCVKKWFRRVRLWMPNVPSCRTATVVFLHCRHCSRQPPVVVRRKESNGLRKTILQMHRLC